MRVGAYSNVVAYLVFSSFSMRIISFWTITEQSIQNLCHFYKIVITYNHRDWGAERGHGPPNVNLGGLPPILYHYIEPVEHLNFCLVFWISATFVSTTKVFFARYQTNTRRHLASDPKRCYLVVSIDFIIEKL